MAARAEGPEPGRRRPAFAGVPGVSGPHRRALRERLATQRLTGPALPRAADAVRLLTCVQSQERDHAYFSLGLRTKGATYASVADEADAGDFLRTHILRPTWHFVAPEDLRWILALTSPRVLSSMAGRQAQVGLGDRRRLARALDRLGGLLTGTALTRREIGDAFAASGSDLPEPGQEMGHFLLAAELEGLICSGPTKGVHHTYALVDERVPAAPELSREEALARLVHRFFAGHGPATIKDFTRWSSLTVADTRAGLAELGDSLEHVDIAGIPHFFDPSVPRRTTRRRSAFLFPVYDEVVLTYPAVNFPIAEGHPHGASDDPFWARVILDGVNVGLWKRAVRGSTVRVETRLAPGLTRAGRDEVRGAAETLAAFLGRELDYVEARGTPHLWGGELGHPARRPRRADR